MIRDRIVVRLRDSSIAQKLQMDHKLTLEKAVSLARQSKAVKTQQSVVRPLAIDDSIAIEAIKRNHQSHHKKPQRSSGMQRKDYPMCTRYGKSPPHTKDKGDYENPDRTNFQFNTNVLKLTYRICIGDEAQSSAL